MSAVTKVGSVILVGLRKRKIHNIVHYISHTDSKNKETLIVLLIAISHVKSQKNSVNNTNRYVSSSQPVSFEFLLVLSILFIVEKLKA